MSPSGHRVLLVEDDKADAFLVSELLRESGDEFELVTVSSLAEARAAMNASVACVLFDLGLPDAEGLDGLTEMLAIARDAAVVVLTGLTDQLRGSDAVTLGAQDYLIKGRVDGETLARSIRYAIGRRRSEETQRQLFEAALLRAENARLERALLPRPLLSTTSLRWATRYRPGGGLALLGGDFFDAVERPDGSVRVVVGDVCGHGPDEAALGVALRVAWRSLVIAGVDESDVLPALERMLEVERFAEHIFATMCDVVLEPGFTRARIRLAGHPSPLLFNGATRSISPLPLRGRALGVLAGAAWEPNVLELGEHWTLLLFTDGISEGRSRTSGERLGLDALSALGEQLLARTSDLDAFADGLMSSVGEGTAGTTSDDIALFVLSRPAARAR
ncbi:MAG: SpoIIE family protein phosphatase [Acidimicrobiales bacterium]|jgi:serine phosphatase RsbU (regulator of sigma subunit)